MKTINSYFYTFLLVFLFCNPICAQNDKKIIKVGKMIQESYFSSWEQDSFLTYYIAADAESTERFIKEGNWKDVLDKRYKPYSMKSMWLIKNILRKF